MSKDLSPETVLSHLEASNVAPYYLFHGHSDFLKERIIDKFKHTVLDPATIDFNFQTLYADEAAPEEVLEAARSMPFMGQCRVVVVRRVDSYNKGEQEVFLPYLDDPVSSTHLLFVASAVDFRQPLFAKIKKVGRSVAFTPPKEGKIVPWLQATARDMGLKISSEACAYLHQVVGNNLMELYGELEKLSVRYGDRSIGVEHVREMAINTRAHSIFELMDAVSEKDSAKALKTLHRLLEQEGKDSALSVVGMLNRQLRLLWQVKTLKKQRRLKEIPSLLGIPQFVARKLQFQVERWEEEELQQFLESLCLADSRLKSGSRKDIILDHLVISLCGDRD